MKKLYTVYQHVTPDDMYYYGQTNDIKRRWSSNGAGYKTTSLYPYIEKFGWDNIKHIILFENQSKEDALKIEDSLIISGWEKGNCINKIRSGNIKNEDWYIKKLHKNYYNKNKDRILEQQRQYQRENREKCNEYQRDYREKNKDKVLNKRRQYQEENKQRIQEQKRQYRQKNKDKLREYEREYQRKNRDKINEYKRQYRQKNRDKILEQNREYREKNREKYNEYHREYLRQYRQRKKEEKQFRELGYLPLF